MADRKPQKKPTPAYAAVVMDRGFLRAALYDGVKTSAVSIGRPAGDPPAALAQWLKDYGREKGVKFIALAARGLDTGGGLRDRLWLDLDIILFDKCRFKDNSLDELKRVSYKISRYFDQNHNPRVRFGPKRRIRPMELTGLAPYSSYATAAELERAEHSAAEFKKRKLKMVFVNATAAGGGVAIMRQAMVHFYRLLGVDVDWHVLRPDLEIFRITKKKLHNVLQAVAPPDCILNDRDKLIYERWTKKNAEFFRPVFGQSDIVVIDDPQPAGLIPWIKKYNKSAKIIYRSHIQICAGLVDRRQKAQWASWQYLWQRIKLADLFVSHPIPAFVPKTVKKHKLVYMPPCTEPLDGLNKPLSKTQLAYYFSLFNEHLAATGQKTLDRRRPYIIQIARFDPSKGIGDVLESFRRLRADLAGKLPKKRLPQLVIAGNGSVDDPEGISILEETRQNLGMDIYADLADDIKVARLPHNDQMLNALLSRCYLALQLSHREGFEFKVSEAMLKGKPVIAYRTGGIPLQIKHKHSGYLVDRTGDTKKAAEYMAKLFLNKEKYEKLSRRAPGDVSHDYLTVNNASKWLEIALSLNPNDPKNIRMPRTS